MKQKVLIVEDEEAIREMYRFKLSAEEYHVKTAKNGREGLMTAKEWRPDLILLDLMMPIMTGEQMLELLRKKSWGANIRVIILTNISRSEAPSILRFLNVDGYIVKAHSTPNEVVKIIKATLD